MRDVLGILLAPIFVAVGITFIVGVMVAAMFDDLTRPRYWR